MSFNAIFIKQCASLGTNNSDKLRLALLGLIAPSREHPHTRWEKLYKSVIPKLWVRPKQLNGARLLIDPADWSQTVIFEEVFIRNAYDLNKVMFAPQVILDCGAHIGIFSLLAKSRFPGAHVTAYEPNPQNSRLVRRQITSNDLDITLIESAISTEAGKLDFAWTNSHNGKLLHNGSNHHAYQVSTIDFPEFLKELRPVSLLLKMDIEGEEMSIFPKIMPFLPRQTAIFFETHSGDAGWREIETLLTSNHFKVDQIISRGLFCDGFAQREQVSKF